MIPSESIAKLSADLEVSSSDRARPDCLKAERNPLPSCHGAKANAGVRTRVDSAPWLEALLGRQFLELPVDLGPGFAKESYSSLGARFDSSVAERDIRNG